MCSENNNPKVLPTRVLDVGDGGVRLVLGRNQLARYIALSHCWGEHRPLTTTTATLDSHLRDIPWASIPQTFQDAIKIVKKLGIRYIWIDSLCIIQNDTDDWTRESALMYDVYSNAYLTLSAASAPDSRFGLFRETETVELSGRTREGHPYLVLVRAKMKHPKHWNLKKTRTYFPIFGRGWVFQEQVLSTRTLHFGHAELIWECKEQLDCECGAVTFRDRGFQKRKHAEAMNHPSHLGDSNCLSERWRQIVCSYSTLTLTVATDKIPALAGLAKQIQAGKGSSDYISGMWSDSLQIDLLWLVPHMQSLSWKFDPSYEEIPARRCHTWRAPSWSWASIDGVIQYPRCALPCTSGLKPLKFYYTVISTPSDSSGEMASSVLRLAGTLFKALLTGKDDKHSISIEGNSPTGSRVFVDDQVNPLSPDLTEEWAVWETEVFCFPLVRGQDSHHSEVTVLPGFPYERGSEMFLGQGDDPIEQDIALILQESSGPGARYYRRIGQMQVNRNMVKTSWEAEPSCFDSSGVKKTIDLI